MCDFNYAFLGSLNACVLPHLLLYHMNLVQLAKSFVARSVVNAETVPTLYP